MAKSSHCSACGGIRTLATKVTNRLKVRVRPRSYLRSIIMTTEYMQFFNRFVQQSLESFGCDLLDTTVGSCRTTIHSPKRIYTKSGFSCCMRHAVVLKMFKVGRAVTFPVLKTGIMAGSVVR
ncbi:hypothetical protein BDDG_07290 [Blastomyces dermatitidis ATCC 18188]|uniref:Uncharacterized protein n=1 Tax=Ajellomyces dermatitidis (strain ATCC 18188 / CBS 674.68) TaxID=653446 RepID=F2TM82_AJEDA|nr:hypothetical protein BDDG_07290 [Blastomyces dermatitidis ATCC 18188]